MLLYEPHGLPASSSDLGTGSEGEEATVAGISLATIVML
jgi:hypothetical protein